MNSLRIQLELDDYSDEVVEIARRFYEIGLERNFTRGHRSELVRLHVFILPVVMSLALYICSFAMCCTLLTQKIFRIVDPSIFIHKFTITLIPEGNDAIVKIARDILANMKRDWMQTGRKPSGLCGAALYISALSHGLKVSKSKIIEVVHICEATLSKRLIEFENTDAGALTMEEFTEKERELRNSSLTIKQPNTGSKETSLDEVLCRHTERKPFAYGLCNECYKEFMKVSGGLEGGSDPPAFQRAEKETLAKLSMEENSNSVSNSTIESGSEKTQNIGLLEDATNKAGIDDDDNNKLPGVDGSDGSDNFSDIDDFEVDSYLLHNEEEKHFKKIIWEEMNREYLEEQAAKEAAIEAAKEALMAKYDKCPEDLQAAQELAAAAAEVVAKSRKERQQKRAAEEKVQKLFDDPVGTEKDKKQELESTLDENEEEGSKIGKAGNEYNGDGGVEEEDHEDNNPEF
ncbi:Cyclin/Brf1-like TBP-binding protein, putative isoform 2 [Hibiscus syriacus]|uniref:Cyclin/Brf1-like TBP-binding protein, putative isoform 2 n=1 Tax=Hibiscus syriacus TaxID=106335 RepID=A0A6A3AHS8_HIBSY|nr:Cyclin/Brf1-like TBP-binding protein, putative isoform 2 [Hibiscus syriacus]